MFVDAGVRGGSEYGETWHEQAMFAQKQNDVRRHDRRGRVADRAEVHAAVEARGRGRQQRRTDRRRACITQRPDLFRAAICQVPLLDMVRFHKFLIARYWIAEYGDPDASRRLPLDPPLLAVPERAQGVNLPETLVVAGEYDSRVDPLHAKKFVAAVQNNPGQVSPFLLYMDFDSGHGTGKTQPAAGRSTATTSCGS